MTTDAKRDAAVAENFRPAPYLLHTSHLVVVEVIFGAAAVRSVLPPGLEPLEDGSGFALFYMSDDSNLFPASSAFYVGVFLRGRDAPDGSPGIFVAQGYYSNEANLEVSRAYSLRFDTGWAEIGVEGDVINARGGPVGSTAMEFAFRRLKDQQPLTMGTHQYYGVLISAEN